MNLWGTMIMILKLVEGIMALDPMVGTKLVRGIMNHDPIGVEGDHGS